MQLAQSHAFLGLGTGKHYTIGFMSTKIIIIAWKIIDFGAVGHSLRGVKEGTYWC